MDAVRHVEIDLELNTRCSYVLAIEHVDDRMEAEINGHAWTVAHLQSGTRARLLPLDPFLRSGQVNELRLRLHNETPRGVVAFNPWRLQAQLCQFAAGTLLPIALIDEGSAPRDNVPEGVVLEVRLRIRLLPEIPPAGDVPR